jgi:diguanylate cyclase (GGDEF)-like protein
MSFFARKKNKAEACAAAARPLYTYGILPRTLFPLGIFVALQFALLVGGIYISGLPKKLDDTVADTLQQTVNARADYLQYDMVNRWCDVDSTVAALNDLYRGITISNDITASQLVQDHTYYDSFLTQAAPEMISLLRKNAVTGVYVVLRNGVLPSDPNTVEQLPGIYLRDRDPGSSYTSENSDVLLERAPLHVVSALDISTDRGWEPLFQLSRSRSNEASFFRPYMAAQTNRNLSYADLAYWAKPYHIENDSYSAISYSVPLVSKDGTLYGVLGVEILTDYLQRQMPVSEIMDGRGSYILCVQDVHGGLSPILVSANDYRYTQEAFSGLTASWDESAGLYRLSTKDLTDFDACSRVFTLYNTHAPNSGDAWILFAAVPHTVLTELSSQVTLTLRGVLFGVLLIMFLAVFLVAYQLSRPIARLEREVRLGIGHSKPVSLTPTGISELDSLAQGVEALNAEVLRSAGKLSQILAMSSTKLGAFEFDRSTHTAYCSEGFFAVFGSNGTFSRDQDSESFIETLHAYDCYILPSSIRKEKNYQECVYQFENNGKPLWVRLKVVFHDSVVTGFTEDITREWSEMRKLEFERDHDALTGIYNRRAFYEAYHTLFTADNGSGLGCAALIMMDLDNLKYVNDTYGHDYGDTYIRIAAKILSACCPAGALAARVSGDEFFLFLPGYDTYEAVQEAVNTLRRELSVRRMKLPNGTDTPVRASAGIAWYPKDTKDPDLLLRYADFAMYKGKHSTKGTFVNFDYGVYCQEAYLLQGKESLNSLIEDGRVEYHFQPILDVRTGQVFAYETLMRPQIAALKNPMDVLKLARQESKLGAIEHMTWFTAMDSFTRFCESGVIDSDCRVFINSVSNQVLSEDDVRRFEEEYAPWLSRIVQEHTEEEQSDPSMLQRKQEYLHRWNAHLALDDYGSGYNGENVLVSAAPDYVKIDMAIVRDVDTDKNKQQLIASLISYAKPRGIRIIAEGVETEGEMREIVALGADYIQGYYIACPAAVPPAADPQHVQAVLDASRALSKPAEKL